MVDYTRTRTPDITVYVLYFNPSRVHFFFLFIFVVPAATHNSHFLSSSICQSNGAMLGHRPQGAFQSTLSWRWGAGFTTRGDECSCNCFSLSSSIFSLASSSCCLCVRSFSIVLRWSSFSSISFLQGERNSQESNKHTLLTSTDLCQLKSCQSLHAMILQSHTRAHEMYTLHFSNTIHMFMSFSMVSICLGDVIG